jgi:fumarate reductase subunit C
VSKRKPYVRSMDGWWKKNPFFVEYVFHESTAIFVLAYAMTLLVGLVRLGQGAEAWTAWLEALKSPMALACHLVLLAAITYHTISWFKIMPITLPPIMVGDKKLSPCAIVTGGLTAAAVAGLALFALVWRIAA